MKKIKRAGIYLGCDPEFFFEKEGKIIGAEKVLPEGGLGTYGNGQVIIDGVQGELNPNPSQCRESLAYFLSNCFSALGKSLPQKVKVVCPQTVQVSKKELSELKPENRRLGCSPSSNLYQNGITVGVDDPSNFLTRSAGGHVHIGMSGTGADRDIMKKSPDRIIRMLDIIVGNFCVMIDRDKGNKKRRQHYGRAGEYRLPSHGIEYRTLSNFWLKSYTLMSMVMSFARLAVSIVTYDEETEQKILSLVKTEDIIKAINNNNYRLARKNYNKIKDILVKICDENEYNPYDGTGYQNPPISSEMLPMIEFFIDTVNEHGLDYWFKKDFKDVVQHWINYREGGRHYGWESFILELVREKMN